MKIVTQIRYIEDDYQIEFMFDYCSKVQISSVTYIVFSHQLASPYADTCSPYWT